MRLETAGHRALRFMDQLNYRLFPVLGLITFAHDPQRASTYRSQVIWEEAQRRGIPMEQFSFLGRLTDMYRAKLGNKWIYFESLPIPESGTQPAYGWIDDKVMLNTVLRENNLPIPRAYSVTNEEDAVRAFTEIGGVAVMKPRTGSRGRHTTTGIRTDRAARDAFRSARKLCKYVYVSPEFEGSVCRGTVVNGQLTGFFQADAPSVIGDGYSSIADLITQKNARKPDRMGDIMLTKEHEAFLQRMGYTPVSILESGKKISLSHRTGRLFGGETRELLEKVHPTLRAYLERAARILNVPVVGFDLIIRDPESDPDAQKWGIIEANSLPFIDLHYLPLHGKPSNVAAAVWDLWPETKDPASAGPR